MNERIEFVLEGEKRWKAGQGRVDVAGSAVWEKRWRPVATAESFPLAPEAGSPRQGCLADQL